MPRTIPVESPGAIYHVMNPGDRREDMVLQKPGGRATQLCARWRHPDGVEERVIPEARPEPPSADL